MSDFATPVTREFSDASTLVREPVVSVVMWAYRHAPYIAQAIESVLAQECDFPYELIIGEDRSPDGTLEIALDFQRRYPDRVRVLSSERNVGLIANAARCDAAARGSLIAVCEGDDYWTDPTKLARQVAVFRQYPQCSLVFHAVTIVDAATGGAIGLSRAANRSRRFLTPEIVLGGGSLVRTVSIMVRRDVLDRHHDWKSQAHVIDYPLALASILVGDAIYLDRAMAAYRSNVPHSWSQRQVHDIDQKVAHARDIDAMLTGFADESADGSAAARSVISKYYADAIVLSNATLDERRQAYRDTAGRLQAIDRMQCIAAAEWGLPMGWARTLHRKARTLLRLALTLGRRDLDIR